MLQYVLQIKLKVCFLKTFLSRIAGIGELGYFVLLSMMLSAVHRIVLEISAARREEMLYALKMKLGNEIWY